MSKSKFEIKRYKKGVQASNFYFGLKSKNEIYFQMASIFKEVTNDEDKLAKTIFNGFLISDSSKISMEKSF